MGPSRAAPTRLELQTCIGCGARERTAPCTGGCVEVRLELVDAQAHDARRAQRDALGAFTAVARRALAPLQGPPPGEAGARARWDALRAGAAAAIAGAPRVPVEGEGEPAAVVTTWWCRTCDRVEAPQPCIGVCVRRPQELVALETHAALDAAAAALEEQGRALLGLLRLVVAVRPRPGGWAATWQALAARAELAAAPAPPHASAPEP